MTRQQLGVFSALRVLLIKVSQVRCLWTKPESVKQWLKIVISTRNPNKSKEMKEVAV